MTHFIEQGNTYSIAPDRALNITSTLPVGTYTVGFSMDRGYYLEVVDGFAVPDKLYGDTRKQAARIFNTFHDREASTGLLLSGEKGSGKTMLAKFLSVSALTQGIPTIIVNAPHHGESFNQFIQQIEQPTIMVFDEFEKVYDREQQESLLTLLDGVYPSKKLFVLTCNNRYRIDDHMNNRPGRIFYHLHYTGLDADFIIEYATDNLNRPERAEEVARISLAFSQFNFDMMKALVEEMNRYDESAQDALLMLNATPDDNEQTFNVEVWIDGQTVLITEPSFTGAPVVSGIEAWFELQREAEDESDEVSTPKSDNDMLTQHRADLARWRKQHQRDLKRQQLNLAEWEKALLIDEEGDLRIALTPSDITEVNAKQGVIVFEKDALKVRLSRQAVKTGHWAAY